MDRSESFLVQFGRILKKASIWSLIVELLPGVIAWFVAMLLSRITSEAVGGNLTEVINDAIQLLILLLGSGLMMVAFDTIKRNTVTRDKQKCKQLLYQNLVDAPLNQAYMRKSGEILELLSDDFEQVTGRWVESIPKFMAGLLISIVYTALFLFHYPISVTIFMVVMALIQLIPPIIVKRFMQINYEKSREIEAEITSHIVAGHQGFDTILVYQLQDWFVEQLKKLQKKYFKIGCSSEITVSAETAMDELVSRLLKYGVYVANGLFALYGVIEIADAVTIIALSTEFFRSVKSVVSIIPSFAVEKTADVRLSGWKQEKSSIEVAWASTLANFDNVVYDIPTKRIFDGLTVSLDLRKRSIIKGANGNGKSTLLRMIIGAVCPNSGTIEISGYLPSELPRSAWTNDIFYLPQDDPVLQITPKEFFVAIGAADAAISMAVEFGLSPKQ